MATFTDDDMQEQNSNSLSSSEPVEHAAKRARCGPYSGPSARADVNAERLPAGHTWTCADCKQELKHEVGVNNVPLCHSPADLKNMRLPVWISYGEVWKGTYCNCVSLCNSCLDKFYNEVCTSIFDINEKEEKYEEEKKHMPSSSLETQVDYLSPTGNPDMPTRQLRALMRTVLVQIREAIFSIMCNRGKDQQP